jgi:hypothetical protein
MIFTLLSQQQLLRRRCHNIHHNVSCDDEHYELVKDLSGVTWLVTPAHE